jgi:hypothetical protein
LENILSDKTAVASNIQSTMGVPIFIHSKINSIGMLWQQSCNIIGHLPINLPFPNAAAA